MESSNGDDGDIKLKLPIGFRFLPTDEELLLHYLKRKICSMPLPAPVIPELDVFDFNPWDLPGDIKEKRYFFCKRSQTSANAEGCGYWKYTGKHKQVMSRARTNNDLVEIGLKSSLVYYKSKHEKTRWMMHEFCLVARPNLTSYSAQMMRQVGEWLVYYVYRRKSSNNPERTRTRTVLKGCVVESPDHQASSPCSSVITEISSSDELDQEIN